MSIDKSLRKNSEIEIDYKWKKSNKAKIAPRSDMEDASLIEKMKSEKILASKNVLLESVYSRLGNLRNANKEFKNKLKYDKSISIPKNLLKIKQKQNIQNYANILHQINHVYESIDNIKTTSFGSLNLRESFLNSGRDFPSEYNYSEYYKKSFLDV